MAEQVIARAKADRSDTVWSGTVLTGPCKWVNHDLQDGHPPCLLPGGDRVCLYDRDWAHCGHAPKVGAGPEALASPRSEGMSAAPYSSARCSRVLWPLTAMNPPGTLLFGRKHARRPTVPSPTATTVETGSRTTSAAYQPMPSNYLPSLPLMNSQQPLRGGGGGARI
jgi:hypothetical protein